MKHVAAYLLAVLGGKTQPSEDDIMNILDSVGIAANDDKLSSLMKELKGKDIHEVICAGREKMAAVPAGGGVAVAGGGATIAAGGGGAPAAEEKAPEPEEEEEEDEDMGFSLFD